MSAVALSVLVAAGVVGYVAVLGVTVDATAENLTADWLSAERTAAISLNSDGTFTASGISRCIGEVGVVVDGSDGPMDVPVPDGAGEWHVEPADHVLLMDFRSPRRMQLRWQVETVNWQFHPAQVNLTSLNPPTSADGTLGHCSLQA
ncbi:hypothetical protein Q0Z83_025160 [Actinoplanes sichuanensis]|nr:hypothetical protein Q0Z83_025160 [Actinoplanes sichuanensis]